MLEYIWCNIDLKIIRNIYIIIVVIKRSNPTLLVPWVCNERVGLIDAVLL